MPYFAEDDTDPRWDEHLEDLANERLAIRRRRARDADSMAETGVPYYDQTDETLPCKPNTP